MSGSGRFVSPRWWTEDPEPADHVGRGDVLGSGVDAPGVRAGLLRAELVLGVARRGWQKLRDKSRVAGIRDVGDDHAKRIPGEVRPLADDLGVVDAEGEACRASLFRVGDQAGGWLEDAQHSWAPW